MAGKVVINQLQLGDSGTATHNFVLQTNVDGSAKLARGNAGATTQDVMTVNSAGVVKTPQNLIAFRAYATGATALTASFSKVSFQAETFDPASAYDTSTSRFQPAVAGYYQINGMVWFTSAGQNEVAIYKNGSLLSYGFYTTTGSLMGVSDIIYLNGSSDYVEIYGYAASSQNTNVSNAAGNYFSGHLLGAA